MDEVRAEQMTLDVGGDPMPILGSFKVSGRLRALTEVEKGASVRVNIVDADGQVIAAALGRVGAITFREHRKRDTPPWTERAHGVKLEEDA